MIKKLCATLALGLSMTCALAQDINFGFISTEASANLKQDWQPLIDDMSRQTGLKVTAACHAGTSPRPAARGFVPALVARWCAGPQHRNRSCQAPAILRSRAGTRACAPGRARKLEFSGAKDLGTLRQIRGACRLCGTHQRQRRLVGVDQVPHMGHV